MPVHVEKMTTQVDAYEGDLPMSQAQIEKLVDIVLKRLEQKQRETKVLRDSTQIRSGVVDI